jgi:hypothetical protein
VEEHSFNQECSVCHEEDEGVGLDDSHLMLFQQTSYTQSSLGKRSLVEEGGSSSNSGGNYKKQRT